jgi:hypothetical protein
MLYLLHVSSIYYMFFVGLKIFDEELKILLCNDNLRMLFMFTLCCREIFEIYFCNMLFLS